MKVNAMKKPVSTKAPNVNTDKAAGKATRVKAKAAAQVIADAALAAAKAASNAWVGMLTKTRTALTGLSLADAESVVNDAKKAAKKEMGEKVNGTVLQYITDAWSVIRAERVAADPGKVKTKAQKAAVAAFKQAAKSGSGKATKEAARDVLKSVGLITGKAPRQPQAPAPAPAPAAKAEEAPKAAPAAKDISPEAREYLRTLRAALVGITLNKAANDALRGLALLLKLDAPADAE